MAALQHVLCVLHQAHSVTGQVGIALSQLGVRVTVVRPLLGQRLPRDLNRFDGLIVFGGPMSANDEHLPGLRTELHLIERWLLSDRPLWGICLGAQLMARALGTAVVSDPEARVEIGWYPLCPVGPGRRVFQGLHQVYHWHREGFGLPAGTVRLAKGVPSASFQEQAFAVGTTGLATQFHPEMNPRMMQRWLSRASHMLELPGARPMDAHHQGSLRYASKKNHWLKRALRNWLERRVLG